MVHECNDYAKKHATHTVSCQLYTIISETILSNSNIMAFWGVGAWCHEAPHP